MPQFSPEALKSKLVDLNKNRTARAIFMTLAERERERKEPLDLRRFRKQLEDAGIKVNMDEYTEVFKRLDALNVGQIVWNTRGGLYKFIWRKVDDEMISPRSVALLALNKKEDVRLTIPREGRTQAKAAEVAGAYPQAGSSISLPFRAKSGRTYTIIAPREIEKEDLADLVMRIS